MFHTLYNNWTVIHNGGHVITPVWTWKLDKTFTLWLTKRYRQTGKPPPEQRDATQRLPWRRQLVRALRRSQERRTRGCPCPRSAGSDSSRRPGSSELSPCTSLRRPAVFGWSPEYRSGPLQTPAGDDLSNNLILYFGKRKYLDRALHSLDNN